MRKKFITAILLVIASLFSFGDVKASLDVVDNYGYMNKIENNIFDKFSYNKPNYGFCKNSLFLENNYPNLYKKIENILDKFENKLKNKSILQKIKIYEKISKKVSDIGNKLTIKNLNFYVLVKIKCDIYDKIETLKNQENNSVNILNNILGSIGGNLAGNNNITSNTEKQLYKIYGDSLSYNLQTNKEVYKNVKLGMFKIDSSDGEYVKLNSFGINILNSKGGKIPSIKYVKLYNSSGKFIRDFEITIKNYSDRVFNISSIRLKPGKYVIIGDVSHLTESVILKTKLSYIYSSSNNSYKQGDFGKVGIVFNTYKIHGYNVKYNLESFNSMISHVTLGTFQIDSSKQPVLIKKMGFKFIETSGKKIPSIKYLKLVDQYGNFVDNLDFESSGKYDITFKIKDLKLKNGIYKIIGDISDLRAYNETSIKSIINYVIDGNCKLINGNFNLGEINIDDLGYKNLIR